MIPGPGSGSSASRFGQLPGDLVDYTPIEPLLVVEVDAKATSSPCLHQRLERPLPPLRLNQDRVPILKNANRQKTSGASLRLRQGRRG